MPIPLAALVALSALGAGAGAISSNMSNRRNAEAQEQMSREQIEAEERLARQKLAADESMADPFRQQLNQASAIKKLDQLERASYMPVGMTPAGPYAGSVPTMTGGYSYEKSPELIGSAGAIKRNVMAGHTAPTMTNPANHGRTAALDLLRILAGDVDAADPTAFKSGPHAGGVSGTRAVPRGARRGAASVNVGGVRSMDSRLQPSFA